MAAILSIDLSQDNVGPGNWMVSYWVEFLWILEFTVVIFGVKSFLSSLGNLDEVSNVLGVGEVGVKVILEMLNEIHVFLDEIVSSNSWEGESTVIKFPGVNGNSWFQSSLGDHSVVDVHGVVVVNHIEASREVIELDIKLSLTDIKSWCAGSGNGTVDDWSWVGVIGSSELNGGSGSNHGDKAIKFHVNS